MASKVHRYNGQNVEVSYDAGRCIHAAECVHGLPKVFDPKARPWVDPDAATADELVAVVAACPTGALQVKRRDGGAGLEAPASNTLRVVEDGPVYARGELEILGTDGEVVIQDTRVALCRCGASANKPFCDGSHSKAEFSAAEGLGEGGVREGGADSGQLQVRPAANGPLIVEGPLTLCGGDEERAGSRTALCRCGASANKPFCDGTHARIGFTAE